MQKKINKTNQIKNKNKTSFRHSNNHTYTHFIFSSRGFMRYEIMTPI